jgi:hypothetical protein
VSRSVYSKPTESHDYFVQLLDAQKTWRRHPHVIQTGVGDPIDIRGLQAEVNVALHNFFQKRGLEYQWQ